MGVFKLGYHRGDVFEEMINISNISYEHKGVALVQKIATPMKPIRNGERIVSAYYEEKSTLDFIGIHKGVPIAFDAKETREETRFPLSNIQPHQVKFMKKWVKHGGKAFLLIHFYNLDKVFRLEYKCIDEFWTEYEKNRGKRGFGSIPLKYFQENCKEITSSDGVILNYLKDM